MLNPTYSQPVQTTKERPKPPPPPSKIVFEVRQGHTLTIYDQATREGHGLAEGQYTAVSDGKWYRLTKGVSKSMRRKNLGAAATYLWNLLHDNPAYRILEPPQA